MHHGQWTLDISPLCFKHAIHIGAIFRGISSLWHLFPSSRCWIPMLIQLAGGPVFCSLITGTVNDVNNSSVIYGISSKVSFASPVKLWKLDMSPLCCRQTKCYMAAECCLPHEVHVRLSHYRSMTFNGTTTPGENRATFAAHRCLPPTMGPTWRQHSC